MSQKPAHTYNENTLVANEDASEDESERPEMFFDWQLITSSKDHKNNQTKECKQGNYVLKFVSIKTFKHMNFKAI